MDEDGYDEDGYDDYGDEGEEFDYDEFVEREFGRPLRSKSTPFHWQIVAILLVLIPLLTTLLILVSL
ncbi:MAG: hypothetical protein AAF802_29895 [Planctomycetota bacterium]